MHLTQAEYDTLVTGRKPKRGRSKPKDAAKAERSRRGCTAPGVMNATEKRYSEILEARRLAGEIAEWSYESLTLILSHRRRCRYTPDFVVVLPGGQVEYHEIKGSYTREDSRIKLKWAADLFSAHVFRLCVYRKGKWRITVV